MATIATIQAAQNKINVDKKGNGTLSFTITNVFGETINMGGKFYSDDSALNGWASVQEPVERELTDQETDTVMVNLDVPAGTKPGQYKFSFLLFSVDNPSLDFTRSDPVMIEVPEPEAVPEPEKFTMKGWMWLIIGIVLLSIVGGIVMYVVSSPNKPSKPGKPTVVIQKKGVDWNRVESVKVTSGRATHTLVKIGAKKWQEQEGNRILFTFTESNRDQWSLYLHDRSRNVNLQVDVWTKKLMYSQGSARKTVLGQVLDVVPSKAVVR